MNKISKKIVALATMAAFVLTLVPAAAFAAHEPSTADVSYQASDIEVTVNGQAVTDETSIYAGEQDQVAIKYVLRDEDRNTTSASANVRLWAVDSKGNITDAMKIVETGWTPSGQPGMTNSYYATVENDGVTHVYFNNDDTYTIYVSAATFDNGDQPKDAEDLAKLTQLGSAKIKVESPADGIEKLNFWGNHNSLEVDGDNDSVVKLDLTDSKFLGDFAINGVDEYTIEGYAYTDTAKDIRAAYATLNLEASRGDDVVELLSDSVKTDANGYFQIKFKMHKHENANIYVFNEDVNYTIRVLAEDNTAENITVLEDNGYVLAGTDKRWNATDYSNLSSGVLFEITNADGDVVTELDSNELATKEGADHERYLSVESRAQRSTLTADDLILVANEDGTFTLKYTGTDKAEAERDLVPGQYVVDVALLSEKHVTVTFNVAEFGSIEDVQLTMKAKNTYGADKVNYHPITDEVTLGQDVDVDAWYVDANGIKIKAEGAQFGIDGKAVYQSQINATDGTFRTVDNAPANESLLGTQIIVTVFDDKAKQLAQETLTVVDAYNTYGLAFDPTQGPANEENNVTVSVVDDNDKVGKVKGTIEYYIADQSNKDANIDIKTIDEVENGKGTIQIYSDKETTVDIVVAVKSTTNAIYPATLEYTVGAEDVNAENTVVMTIGSTDYVVNNDIVKGDAAPYVDEAWRTMVPFRVLGETFGATVDWDQDSQTVTYTYGDTELVMTIGEDTYTINGEEFDMDTAPVLSGDRTYVPVRFVGEALGYTVTALYDGETGLTASVVFQK